MNTETYQEFKKRQSKELNDFTGIFWAFSDEQFIKGMKSIGLTPDDTKLISSLGSGGYILRTKKSAFHDMFERHEQEKKDKLKDDEFLLQALSYELSNYEYCITYDLSEALGALGLEEENIPVDILRIATGRALQCA